MGEFMGDMIINDISIDKLFTQIPESTLKTELIQNHKNAVALKTESGIYCGTVFRSLLLNIIDAKAYAGIEFAEVYFDAVKKANGGNIDKILSRSYVSKLKDDLLFGLLLRYHNQSNKTH